MKTLQLIATAALVSAPASSQEPAANDVPRVLFLTHSAGYEHGVVKRPSPDELSHAEASLIAAARAGRRVSTGMFSAVSPDGLAWHDHRLIVKEEAPDAGQVVVGAWHARRVKTAEDFALAGRGLNGWILSGTLVATWIGTGSIFGNAEFTYENGAIAFGDIFSFFDRPARQWLKTLTRLKKQLRRKSAII